MFVCKVLLYWASHTVIYEIFGSDPASCISHWFSSIANVKCIPEPHNVTGNAWWGRNVVFRCSGIHAQCQSTIASCFPIGRNFAGRLRSRPAKAGCRVEENIFCEWSLSRSFEIAREFTKPAWRTSRVMHISGSRTPIRSQFAKGFI